MIKAGILGGGQLGRMLLQQLPLNNGCKHKVILLPCHLTLTMTGITLKLKSVSSLLAQPQLLVTIKQIGMQHTAIKLIQLRLLEQQLRH